MKKLITFICILFISGCTQNNETHSDIITSFYPLYDLTQAIVKDEFSVKNIQPLSQEVHDFEPSSKDLIALENAKLLIVHGAHLEGWLESALENTKNESLKVLVLSDSITMDGSDVHTWLSIDNMKVYAEEIMNSVISLEGDSQEIIKANTQTWIAKAQDLQELANPYLESLRGSDVLVDHTAFHYLLNPFGINQVSITGSISAEEITPKQIEKVIEKIQDDGISVIFEGEQSNANLMNIIQKETGVEVRKLYTLELMSAKDYKSYLDMMKINYEALIGKAL